MSLGEKGKSHFSEPVAVHVAPWVQEHAKTIKEATRLKSSGDIGAAINKCRISIAHCERVYGSAPSAGKFTNTLRDHFKLARYLTEAGQTKDAWTVLSDRLDAAGDSRNAFGASGVPINRSLVYTEMRKLAAKTGDYTSALKYAAAEMVAWNQSLVLQQRIQELPRIPIEVDDLPRYIKTYCSRSGSGFTVGDYAGFLNSVYQNAKGRHLSINLEQLQNNITLLIANSKATREDVTVE